MNRSKPTTRQLHRALNGIEETINSFLSSQPEPPPPRHSRRVRGLEPVYQNSEELSAMADNDAAAAAATGAAAAALNGNQNNVNNVANEQDGLAAAAALAAATAANIGVPQGQAAAAIAAIRPHADMFPPAFSNTGGGPSVRDFFAHMTTVFDMLQYPDALRLQYILIKLTGTPRRWYTEYQRAKIADGTWNTLTWAQFCRDANERIDPSGSELLLETQLNEKKQSATESADDHVYACLDMCHRLDPNMGELARVRKAVNGLRNGLKKDVLMEKPRTVTELLEAIHLVEETSKLTTDEHISSSTASSSSTSSSSASLLNAALVAQNVQMAAQLNELRAQRSAQAPVVLPPAPTSAAVAALPTLSASPASNESQIIAQLQQQVANLEQQQQQRQQQSRNNYNNNNRPSQRFDNNSSRHSGTRTADGRPVCRRCGRKAHSAFQCNMSKDIECHRCGARGHVQRACENIPRSNSFQQQGYNNRQQQPQQQQQQQRQPQQQQSPAFAFALPAQSTSQPQQQQYFVLPQQQQQQQQQQPQFIFAAAPAAATAAAPQGNSQSSQ
jgi:hypothetical protein